jgi:hypothetical protein
MADQIQTGLVNGHQCQAIPFGRKSAAQINEVDGLRVGQLGWVRKLPSGLEIQMPLDK